MKFLSRETGETTAHKLKFGNILWRVQLYCEFRNPLFLVSIAGQGAPGALIHPSSCLSTRPTGFLHPNSGVAM